jgi:hypothetical protein
MIHDPWMKKWVEGFFTANLMRNAGNLERTGQKC